MSQSNTINPYSEIGGYMSTGLAAIELAAPTTEDALVTAVADFVASVFYQGAPSTQVSIELKSIARNAINSYRSNLVLHGLADFNREQSPFIGMLIGAGMTSNTAPASFNDTVSEIENNIGISALRVGEQTPLFLATTIGINASLYWATQIASPSPFWVSFIGTNAGKNYMNSLLWNVAAMNGALAAYGSSTNGMVQPSTDAVTNQIISALTGGLVITAGKVMFNWIPKIVKPIYQFSTDSNEGGVLPGGPGVERNGGQFTNSCVDTYVGISGDNYSCSDDHKSFGRLHWYIC